MQACAWRQGSDVATGVGIPMSHDGSRDSTLGPEPGNVALETRSLLNV